MPDREPFSVHRFTADDAFLAGPVIYHGGFLKATSGGAATAEIFDDQTAEDLHFRDAFAATASQHDQHLIDPGLRFLHGLFVDLGSNVDHFLVYYEIEDPDRAHSPE